jgi:hypothetical protein
VFLLTPLRVDVAVTKSLESVQPKSARQKKDIHVVDSELLGIDFIA